MTDPKPEVDITEPEEADAGVLDDAELETEGESAEDAAPPDEGGTT